jgi:pimeloyl-ACP methyl ester carboxylesterase
MAAVFGSATQKRVRGIRSFSFRDSPVASRSSRASSTASRPEFRVVAADLPGSGESEPIPREYTPDYYEDDARTFATFVGEVIGRPAHLVGFSDGGEVALLMAIQDPSIAMTCRRMGFLRVPSTGDGRHGRRDGRDRRHPMPGTEGFREYFVGAYGEGQRTTHDPQLVGGRRWDHRPGVAR